MRKSVFFLVILLFVIPLDVKASPTPVTVGANLMTDGNNMDTSLKVTIFYEAEDSNGLPISTWIDTDNNLDAYNGPIYYWDIWPDTDKSLLYFSIAIAPGTSISIFVEGYNPLEIPGESTGTIPQLANNYWLEPLSQEVQLTLPSGWSMISLPVDATNKKLNTLFPGAVVVYGYERGSGYVRVGNTDVLMVGMGYWILLKEETTYTIPGSGIGYYNLSVQDGWYMIGGCSYNAEVSGDNCSIGVIYGYEQGIGYKRIQTGKSLKSGEGYWILIKNSEQNAQIIVE